MGTERQIKGSLDISLHQIFMNFRLIPSIGGLAELFLVACKVGTVIWTDILNLAPPCYESSQRQQEEIGVQTERDFDVHHAITRQVKITPYILRDFDQAALEKDDTNCCETETGLFSLRSLLWRSRIFRVDDLARTVDQNDRWSRDYQLRYMIGFSQDDLILSIKWFWRQAQSPAHTQQAIDQNWVQTSKHSYLSRHAPRWPTWLLSWTPQKMMQLNTLQDF